MTWRTIVPPDVAAARAPGTDWAMVDCRFALADPERGERDYIYCHARGAVYAHLDRDLSGPVIPGRTGRHPLPDPVALAATFGRLGIGPTTQVVAYDDAGGAFAARLWWLLRWLGHDAVAVLDGGWPAWLAAEGPTAAGVESRPSAAFIPRIRPELVLDAAAVEAMRLDPRRRLLDARGADRYRGENETIDPVAGHIPGAVSAPFAANLGPDGRFKPAAELRARYTELLAGVAPDGAVVYCGSGVTAAHDLVALAHAGLDGARLYAGSWSEWITDPARAVGVGGADVFGASM